MISYSTSAKLKDDLKLSAATSMLQRKNTNCKQMKHNLQFFTKVVPARY